MVVCGKAAGVVLAHWKACALGLLVPVVGGLATFGATRHGPAVSTTREHAVIRVEGSDTMVNLAQAWAEIYNAEHRQVSVQVLGGGSGVGIASLIDGNCDLANSSRRINDDEAARVQAARGVRPVELVVGYDALAVFVHPSNPIETLTLDQLAAIYDWDGRLTQWSQLDNGHWRDGQDAIIRIGRQAGCGTYAYFRETVLGRGHDFKLGSVDQSGSKAVVTLVSRTPNAIGYSGMGYATSEVKTVRVVASSGTPRVTPTATDAGATPTATGAGVTPTSTRGGDGSHPIMRPLLIYTAGEPTGPLRDFVEWILSADGQAVVRELGYVPRDEHE